MSLRHSDTRSIRTLAMGCFLVAGLSGCNIVADAICDLTGEEADCLIPDRSYYDSGMYTYSYADDEDDSYDGGGGSGSSDDDGDGSGSAEGDDDGGSGSGSSGDGGSSSGSTGSGSGSSGSGSTGGSSGSSGSGSGAGDGSADDGDWDADGGETTGDDGGGPSPGDPCGSTDLYTCDLSCNSASMIAVWRGDGYCNDASPDLNCAAFDYDDGDCAEEGGTGGSSTGGSTGGSSSGGSTSGSSTGDDIDPEPGGECSGGDGVYDCDLDCRATSLLDWVGDEFCDCGWSCSGGPNLNCAAFGFDGGDCEPGSSCHDGEGIYDCSLDCLGPPSAILGRVGDGSCNTSSPDLDCSSFSYDGGDCSKAAASDWGASGSTSESSGTSAEADICTE
jgi:hypothetical protein